MLVLLYISHSVTCIFHYYHCYIEKRENRLDKSSLYRFEIRSLSALNVILKILMVVS